MNKAKSNHQLPIYIGTSVLVLLLVLVVGGPMFMSAATIGGREFCPNTFQTRSFQYGRIPWTKIRTSGTSYSNTVSPSSKYILSHLSGGGTQVWHPMDASRGMAQDNYPAQILYSYLKTLGPNSESYWDEWSFRNPKHAAVLWPIVQEAAIHELYLGMPELFRTVDERLSTDQLSAALKGVCLIATIQRANYLQATEATEDRKSLLQWAKVFFEGVPADAESKAWLDAIVLD